jgi:hypothetical protein
LPNDTFNLVAERVGSRSNFGPLNDGLASIPSKDADVESSAILRLDGIERPLVSRLDPARPETIAILREHSRAVEGGRPLYRDPISGLSVFTAVFLADRGYCCGSGCRHCPYEQT